MNARAVLFLKGGTVYTISPTATIREAMAMLIRHRTGSLMTMDSNTANRIRQLPILDRGKLMGIISIGDVIRDESREMVVENRYLKTMVFGAGDPSLS